MSFILDALKKSESERQRQNGPGLLEVKVAPPRSRLPLWVGLISVLLLINLGVVVWLLMRGSPNKPEQPPANAALTPLPAAVIAPPVVATPAPAPQAITPSTMPVLPPFSEEGSAAIGEDPVLTDEVESEDDEPAIEPPAGGAIQRIPNPAAQGKPSNLPLYKNVAATPGANIPQLSLDLHAYATDPQSRFVFINMQKLQEGQSTQTGVQVDRITPEGAELSYNGTQFMLPRQ